MTLPRLFFVGGQCRGLNSGPCCLTLFCQIFEIKVWFLHIVYITEKIIKSASCSYERTKNNNKNQKRTPEACMDGCLSPTPKASFPLSNATLSWRLLSNDLENTGVNQNVQVGCEQWRRPRLEWAVFTKERQTHVHSTRFFK